MISSNLPLMQSAAENLFSGAKGQCQKIFVGNKAYDDKETLIDDDEPNEDITLQIDQNQISNSVDIFSIQQGSKFPPDNSSVMNIAANNTENSNTIGFPSRTVPESNMDDNQGNDEQQNDEDEFLVKFD